MGKVVSKIVDQGRIQEVRGTSDTVKIWEGYRDQALMWRALVLLQFPITMGAIILAVLIWQGRITHVHVPQKPAPGIYHPSDIPDVMFVEHSTEFVNLIASYTPAVARRQFTAARERLLEPLLSKFSQEILGDELKTIESTNRSQLFFIDPTKTRLARNENGVEVVFVGERLKTVSDRNLPAVISQYVITMKTIPRNEINQYGIIITNITFEDLKRK
jgi:hypothetical protein